MVVVVVGLLQLFIDLLVVSVLVWRLVVVKNETEAPLVGTAATLVLIWEEPDLP